MEKYFAQGHTTISSRDPSHTTCQWSKRPWNLRAYSGMIRPFVNGAFISLQDSRRRNDANSGVQILGFKYQHHYLQLGDITTQGWSTAVYFILSLKQVP